MLVVPPSLYDTNIPAITELLPVYETICLRRIMPGIRGAFAGMCSALLGALLAALLGALLFRFCLLGVALLCFALPRSAYLLLFCFVLLLLLVLSHVSHLSYLP